MSSYEQDTFDVVIKGVITDAVIGNEVRYIAASPADRRASFTGSGLPFHSEKQAFEGTPNKGRITLNANTFEIKLLFPNSYYVELGNKLVPPTLYVHYTTGNSEERMVSIKLSDPIPYRLLGYPKDFTQPRTGPTFYHAHHNLPVRSQEAILRDSAYPSKNKMSEDFWGLKPAL